MAVKRSKRIQLIVDIAQNAEKQAARNLGVAQDAAQSERKRLEDVKQYYQNYNKVQTLEKFQVQCANSESLEAAKLEQKLIDEMASSRFRHSV